MPCGTGSYCTTVATAPVACTNKPANTYYTNTATSNTCQWACNSGYYLNTITNASCISCPANSYCNGNQQTLCPTTTYSFPLAGDSSQCLCKPGYYGFGGTSQCASCVANTYCPGNNTNLSQACPGNSSSPPASNLITQCQCNPGYQGVNGSTCSLCPSNTLCVSGTLSNCNANAQSNPGSYVKCTCVPGYYSLISGGSCLSCPANSVCTGDTSIAACTTNAYSPQFSSTYTACVCGSGYVGMANATCTACQTGAWCAAGTPNTCTPGSNSPAYSSTSNNCSCNAGYYGPNGGPCLICTPGYFSASPGQPACSSCPVYNSVFGSFTPAYGTTSCSATRVCGAGFWPSPAYNATQDNTCALCPANTICYNNTYSNCPMLSISPPGTGNYTGCYCPAGTTGNVTGMATAACTSCPLGRFCPGTPCQC